MAWSDRPWVLEGASLRVSIIGFDGGEEQQRTLDDQPVNAINPDLTAKLLTTDIQRLLENQTITYMGKIKVGPFELTEAQALQMVAQSNSSGRSNRDVVHPLCGGDDITGRPKHEWVIDFGPTLLEAEAALYEAPYAYVQQYVKPEREKNNRASYRTYWWRHGEPRPALWKALEGKKRYIVTVLVAKHRLFTWLSVDISPAARLIVFVREDDYFFGVLHSRVHELWALRMGARHGGERPTYNNTTCFETFPFPYPPGTEPSEDASPIVREIADAARELVRLRDAWLNPEGASEAELKQRTLTNLYNKRPDWLDTIHQRLDAAVCVAYGWPGDLSDEQILERLLALNVARAQG